MEHISQEDIGLLEPLFPQQQQRQQQLLIPVAAATSTTTAPPRRQQQCKQHQLSLSLRLSYCCIGMIMSLPNTALLYLINTSIPIPITLLPLYASIGFLPYSLKPTYAYISSSISLLTTAASSSSSRHFQISFLLCLCGFSYISTAFLPRHSTATTIPSTTLVVVTFFLAFLRSITLAWPTFLFDLTLLDEVDATIVVSRRQQGQRQPPSELEPQTLQQPQQPLLSYAEIAALYQSQAATYRSIGCIMANIVAVLILSAPKLFYVSQSYYHHHHQLMMSNIQQYQSDSSTTTNSNNGMNHTMFQFLLIVTGGINFICAIVVWWLQRSSTSSSNSTKSNNNNYTTTTSTSSRHQGSVLSDTDTALEVLIPLLSDSSRNNEYAVQVAPTTTTTRTKTTKRIPSYDSIEDEELVREEDLLLQHHHHQQRNTIYSNNGNLEIDACIVDTDPLFLPSGATNAVSLTSRLSSATATQQFHNDNNTNTSTTCNDSTVTNEYSSGGIWLVVALQLLVVSFAMRQSIFTHTLLKYIWICFVAILTLLILVVVPCCVYGWQSSRTKTVATTRTSATAASCRSQQKQQNHQLRVGLYLILRYSIPSVSYLMSSYIYTIYQEIPFMLQVFSLIDMCVMTIACYTYSTYLSRYSSNMTQLLWLIAITTILSGIASFGNVILIRILNPTTTSPTPYSITTKIICTILIKAVISFFSEWKFFPDVVLATISVSSNSDSDNTNDAACSDNSPSNTTAANQVQTATTDPNVNGTQPMASHLENYCGSNKHSGNNGNDIKVQSPSSSSSSSSIGVQYGTLLSCIDFGDQIGILLAGPLVAMFHVTARDDDDDTDTDPNHHHRHWEHMEGLQMTNSILMLLSIVLLLILVRR